MAESDDPAFKDFVEEASEHLLVLNRDFLELEDKGASAPPELINEAFRAAHTIKGLSGMLGLESINALAHGMEDALALVRQGEVQLCGDLAQALFSALDRLSELVADVGRGRMGDAGVDDAAAQIASALAECAKSEDGRSGASQSTEPEAARNEAVQAPSSRGADGSSLQAIRVDVAKLDRTLALVGELVILRSRYNHVASQALGDLLKLSGASRRVMSLQSELNEVESTMGRTLSEMQDAVMKSRLVPLGTVFSRLRRAARDMATKLGKHVRFESTGGETELDKKVIDQVADPLMHLVRNAVDHGIERVSDRFGAGKSEEGLVSLAVSQQGDRVVIEVADDGRGLDRAGILARAIERGLVSPDRAGELKDAEVHELICRPGFSTARRVTDLSGRGVGMDVVSKAVGDLKGVLHIESTPGRGSVFRIRLPLTMVIMDALLVDVRGEIYAISVNAVTEIVELDRAHVHDLGGREVFQIDERVIPIVDLSSALDSTRGAVEAPDARATTVVVDSGDGQVGLGVDRVVGQREIVVKSLSRRFERVAEISGGSVLGDGSVCLIIDVPSLVERFGRDVPQPAGGLA